MNLPTGAPEWLETAFTEFEEKAAAQVREGKDHAYAAGYFSAIGDFKDLIADKAAFEAARKREMYDLAMKGAMRNAAS